ncbi:MAG: HU family DNA-binding protein [Balneolaceae bacterium]
MNTTFIKAFKEAIREEIIKKNTVALEGLGRFEVIHQKQHQKKLDDGQVLMVPPRDVVVFTPENREGK